MDYQAFRTFLLVDEAKAPITADKMVERLDAAVQRGFDVKQFLDSIENAQFAGRNYLAERRRKGTPDAYNSDIKVLRALLRWRGWDKHVTFKRVPPPRVQLRALRDDQVFTLFGYRAQSEEVEKRNRALLLVALKTGMRASEIAAMDVTDLDARNYRIQVRKPAKGGLRRWLPVEKWVFSPKRPLVAWLKARPEPAKDKGALWTTTAPAGTSSGIARGARRIDADFLRRGFYEIGDTVGVPINFNITRHTRGTELRRLGWDLTYIQFYLGHSDVSSTAIYAEVHPHDVEKFMRRRPGRDFFNDMGE